MCPVKAKNDENQGHKPHEIFYKRNSSTLKMHFLVLPVENKFIEELLQTGYAVRIERGLLCNRRQGSFPFKENNKKRATNRTIHPLNIKTVRNANCE